MEHRATSTFPLGMTPRIKAIRLTLDPVRVLSRPLVLYGFVWMLVKLMMVYDCRSVGLAQYAPTLYRLATKSGIYATASDGLDPAPHPDGVLR